MQAYSVVLLQAYHVVRLQAYHAVSIQAYLVSEDLRLVSRITSSIQHRYSGDVGLKLSHSNSLRPYVRDSRSGGRGQLVLELRLGSHRGGGDRNCIPHF